MKKTVKALALLGALVSASLAQGEDIDIYGQNSGGPKPNIIIIADNAGRDNSNSNTTCPAQNNIVTSTIIGIIQCALYTTVQGVSGQQQLLGKFNLGLMVYGYQNNQGGQWIIPSITPGAANVSASLPTMDAAGVSSFLTSVTPPIQTANAASSSGGMQEAWAFFTGSPAAATEVFGSKTTYVSHESLSCQKSFIIFIGGAVKNGAPENGSNTGAVGGAQGLANAGATVPQQKWIDYSSLGPDTFFNEDKAWGDEWARFLYQTDFSGSQANSQNVVTYTIAATGGSLGLKPNPDYVEYLKSMANQGGGKAFVADDLNSMVQALLQIFNEIQSVNSVFASSSLPISSNSQGTYLNQIFIGMFRPDGSANPRWMGNLKQYQFGVGGTPALPTLFLADKKGNSAISGAGTGFISPNAVSFWNADPVDTSKLPDSIGGFWVNNPQSAGGGYDDPDGEIVEKGGVGQQIRLANLQDNYTTNATGPRNVYTCTGSTGSCANGAALSATPFATTNQDLTAAALGISNPTYTGAVSQISRSGNTATLTLSPAASPAISLPTSITLTGSTSANYDGSFASASPTVSPAAPSATTSVSWTITETPVTNPTGTYTATGAGTPTTSITNVTRTSFAGQNTATVTVSDITLGTGTALSVGASVAVRGVTDSNSNPSPSNPYNGQFTVTAVDTVNKTFSYTFMGLPAIPAGNGGGKNPATFCIGTKCNGSKLTQTIDTATAALPGLVRGNGQILMINFPSGSLLTSTAAINGNSVSISGNIVDVSNNAATAYAVDNIGQVKSTGTACSVTYVNSSGVTVTYTGNPDSSTTSGGKNPTTTYTYTSVCVDISSGVIKISPALTAQTQTGASAILTSGTFTSTITSMTRGASNCPTSNLATVTATTSSPYLFANNSQVTIAGTNQGLNEGAYNNEFTITTTGSTTFTFQVPTSPPCTDTKAGMQITYQSSSGGIAASDLINWVRGDDNVGDERSPGNGITIRPSVHGDVLHSRPVVVNYGGTIGVVVFYGANDGTFRAINGNQPINGSLTIGTTPPGGEIWSFIPTEFFSKLQRLYQNSPTVKLASTPDGITPTPQPKDYFFDGSTGVYQSGSSVTLFLSSRRGGRFIYALDVSDPTAPKLKWKKSYTDTDMSELGYTWSTPKAAIVRGYANPVVIFGAGYDTNEDSEPPSTDTMGRGIFILDATDGSIVWRAGMGGSSTGTCTGSPCQVSDMTYAIPGDIALVNRDFDTTGYIDRLYAADLGGNIWRVDLEPAGYATTGALDANGNSTGTNNQIGPSTWRLTKFAALGGSSSNTTKRKFFYPPDVVATKAFDMVLPVSGDREHPLYSSNTSQAYSIVNRMYGLKDYNTGPCAVPISGTLAANNASCSTTTTTWPSTSVIVDNTDDTDTNDPAVTGMTDVTPTAANPSPTYDQTTANNGFYLTLMSAGEKGVNAPLTVGGFTYFGTNTPQVPTSTTCTTLGTARGYAVNFLTGSAMPGGSLYTTFATGGLPPSPVAGLVTVPVNGTDRLVPFCLGCGDPTAANSSSAGPDATSSLGGSKPKIPVPPIRKRIYWYIDRHDS